MRKTIAIVAGGDSGEFEISILSGTIVKEHLDTQQYETYLIVFENNIWSYTNDEGKKYIVNRDDFSLEISGNKIRFDAVFNAIHGTPGEDGKLQEYLDRIGIPYTSCGYETSVLTFNKYLCNQKVAEYGIKVAASVLFQKGKAADYDEALRICSLPCFVKPNNGGSSVGMSKVNNAESLPEAVHKAFNEDDQVLVEGFIPGREITCGVIIRNEKIHALPITEVISENEFFDYEAKYTDGLAREITPADIPIDVEQECKATSKKLYAALNCKGFVRFDYIFNDNGMYFLEVNTVPGLSPNSIVPQQANADGISLSELFSQAIEQAINP
jgi:D-alanine-D-alanine ligase